MTGTLRWLSLKLGSLRELFLITASPRELSLMTASPCELSPMPSSPCELSLMLGAVRELPLTTSLDDAPWSVLKLLWEFLTCALEIEGIGEELSPMSSSPCELSLMLGAVRELPLTTSLDDAPWFVLKLLWEFLTCALEIEGIGEELSLMSSSPCELSLMLGAVGELPLTTSLDDAPWFVLKLLWEFLTCALEIEGIGEELSLMSSSPCELSLMLGAVRELPLTTSFDDAPWSVLALLWVFLTYKLAIEGIGEELSLMPASPCVLSLMIGAVRELPLTTSLDDASLSVLALLWEFLTCALEVESTDVGGRLCVERVSSGCGGKFSNMYAICLLKRSSPRTSRISSSDCSLSITSTNSSSSSSSVSSASSSAKSS